MEELLKLMKQAHADTFVFYLKAHNFHWNVEGDDFPQYHSFFGELYEEVFDAVDGMAEQIRTLGDYAPGTLDLFKTYSTIEEYPSIPSKEAMVAQLSRDNQKVITSLMEAYKMCERFGEFGVSNFLQDRVTAHKKHAWMLKASMKGSEQ